MIVNTNCLWTILATTLLGILTNNLCQCKSTYDVQNDIDNIYSDSAEILQPSFPESSAEKEVLNSGRPKLMSWEKRSWDKNFAVWGKRRWENLPTWGKIGENDEDLSIAQLNPEKRKWSKFMSWGKREMPLDFDDEWRGQQQQPEDKRKLEVLEEPLNVDEQILPKMTTWYNTQGLENNMDNKRKWPLLTTWGKRDFDDSLADADKRRWSKFTSWGKRDGEPVLDDVDKRKWAKFASWGKRESEPIDGDVDKRKWAKFTSWGKRESEPILDDVDKRKWAKFTSWGKRESEPLLDDVDKRKWAKFTSWGKRSELDDILDADKRKWAKFASWGKRNDVIERDRTEDNPEKRKWSRLAVWGKRADEESDTVDKRNWSKFASWGKRPRDPKTWLALNTWGKRRWTGLTTWGKRSGSEFKAETMARKLLRLFDVNGDGALDLDELNNYIRTLMSLPSKQKAEVESPKEEQ